MREECTRAVAGLPARDRRRRQPDRGDGQDRRPLLLLPAPQADARHHPRLDADRRHRPRRHQRGARRLRRQGDGPHRAPARPRRPGLPPRQPGAAEHRRADQHLRGGGEGPAVRRTRSTAASPGCVPTNLLPRALQPDRAAGCRPAARARQPRARPDHRAPRHPAGGARPRLLPLDLRLAHHREGAVRFRHLRARPRVLRHAPVDLLGGDARRLDQERHRGRQGR